MTRALFLGVLASLIDPLFGCPITAAAAPKQASFQTVLKGYESGICDPLETVARNQSDWKALWHRHVSTGASQSTLPSINFSKKIVSAVFLGEKPTGGHDMEITKVEQTDGKLVVSVFERRVPPGSLTTQALTQPFHIVKVAAPNSASVSFRRLP